MCVSTSGFLFGAALILLSMAGFTATTFKKFYEWLIFSESAPIVTLGVGGCWFLKNVLSLSKADFGAYRVQLFIFFASIILLSFFKMNELLSIRGVAVLCLVCAHSILENVYCESIFLANWITAAAYAVIVFAMIIGTAPYILRNFLESLSKRRFMRISCSALLLCFGVSLLLISLQRI